MMKGALLDARVAASFADAPAAYRGPTANKAVSSCAFHLRQPLFSSCTPSRPRNPFVVAASRSSEEEPDWEAEMSIFKQRISQPNQLATLRELESKANVGKVMHCQENLAIVAGLNSDAPVGTKLAFVSGAQGVLLWHRSNNLTFVLILGGASNVAIGEAVECKIRGVLQVIDETNGPVTRKDFELLQSPVGGELFGQVVDFFGRPSGSKTPMGADITRPLIKDQVRPGAAPCFSRHPGRQPACSCCQRCHASCKILSTLMSIPGLLSC